MKLWMSAIERIRRCPLLAGSANAWQAQREIFPLGGLLSDSGHKNAQE